MLFQKIEVYGRERFDEITRNEVNVDAAIPLNNQVVLIIENENGPSEASAFFVADPNAESDEKDSEIDVYEINFAKLRNYHILFEFDGIELNLVNFDY
jgi:hypothetical protein